MIVFPEVTLILVRLLCIYKTMFLLFHRKTRTTIRFMKFIKFIRIQLKVLNLCTPHFPQASSWILTCPVIKTGGVWFFFGLPFKFKKKKKSTTGILKPQNECVHHQHLFELRELDLVPRPSAVLTLTHCIHSTPSTPTARLKNPALHSVLLSP